MGQPALDAETIYVRECAKAYVSEIGFTPTADSELSALGAFWPSVHQVLRTGKVIWSDKEDADSTVSIVVGRDCDGDRYILNLRWSSQKFAVLVEGVKRS